MNFSQLHCFVTLADVGSFTETAFAIHMTQSAVSHALIALESELGVTLFDRNRKGIVALTEVGQAMLPHARALLAQAEAIEQQAKASRGLAEGKLRLGSIKSLVPPALLVKALSQFQQYYPDISVVLFEGAMHEVGEWVEKSIVDIGFILLPVEDLATTPLLTSELCVLVSSQHPLQAKAAVTFQDVIEEGFIMEKTHCALHFIQMAGFPQQGKKPLIRYHASDSATILAMVREGLGITLMPRMMLPDERDGFIALPFAPAQHIAIGVGVKSIESASLAAMWFIQTMQHLGAMA